MPVPAAPGARVDFFEVTQRGGGDPWRSERVICDAAPWNDESLPSLDDNDDDDDSVV